jgi:hypothetical protein
MKYKVVIEDTSEHYIQTLCTDQRQAAAADIARNCNIFFASMALHFCSFAKPMQEEAEAMPGSPAPRVFVIHTLGEVERTYHVTLAQGGIREAQAAWENDRDIQPSSEDDLKGQEIIRITDPEGNEAEYEGGEPAEDEDENGEDDETEG